MKKTVFQITVLAMFLILGCSKDELMTTEQSSNTTEKKTLIENNKNQNKYGLTLIEFESISTDGAFYTIREYPNPQTTRKVLKKGTFSGNIRGYGKIIPSLSPYTFNDLLEEGNGGYPEITDEPFWYRVVGSGKISLSANDTCSITIKDVIINPHYSVPGSIAGYPYGWFGIAPNYDGIIIVQNGFGKLKNLNKTLKVKRGDFFKNDLTTGQIHLKYYEPTPN